MFLSKVVDYIIETNDIENCKIILPNRRSGVFLKREISKKLQNTIFAPEIITIEDFISEITGIETIDNTTLLFEFYNCIKQNKKDIEPFETFIQWAPMALKDFSEIDTYCIDSNEILSYIIDIKRVEKWGQKTQIIEKYISFWKDLKLYYQFLRKHLLDKNTVYSGLNFRIASEKINDYKSDKKIYFVGFNALSESEKIIIKTLEKNLKAEILWDVDRYYLNSNAGRFIKPFVDSDFKWVSNDFKNKKNINIISSDKNTNQCVIAGEIINSLEKTENTALVLADESLLIPMLNSLPESTDKVNVTMGYPVSNSIWMDFFSSIFDILSTGKDEFYYKDFFSIIDNPNYLKYLNNTSFFEEIIDFKKQIYDNKTIIISLLQIRKLKEPIITNIFDKKLQPKELLENLLEIIKIIRCEFLDKKNIIDNEILFHFEKKITKIHGLINPDFKITTKTISKLFKSLVKTDKLSFFGEPLSGIQLMGILETRLLDFENITLISANEGIIPEGKTDNSFIPYDVKIEYQLPTTYKYFDAIFEYHFFRLIQRAKNVNIIYNTNSEGLNNGEKSRFVLKLENDFKDKYNINYLKFEQNENSPIEIKIEKTPEVLTEIKKIFKKGISASSIKSYIRNPMDFYRKKLLGIYDENEFEETITPPIFGNIIHGVLEELYKPFIGKIVIDVDVSDMIEKCKNLIIKYIELEYSKNYKTGINKIMFEVAQQFLDNFLQNELKLVQNNTLEILDIEKSFSCNFTNNLNIPIKFVGKIDRIDKLNGAVRIIDYKTGVVEQNNLKITKLTIDNLLEKTDYNIIIQLSIYDYLIRNNYNFTEIELGVISFPKLKNGFMQLQTNKKENLEESISFILSNLENLFGQMLNPEIPFEEK